jgi:hypothetical protein
MSKQLKQMYEAVVRGDVRAVKDLLRTEPELLHAGPSHGSWLYWAAGHDSVAMVEFLVEAGIDVNAEEVYGGRPLDAAAMSGCAAVASWLLDHGAKMRPTAPQEGGTLIGAVNSGSLELVRLLLDHGADINSAHGSPPRNALSHALDFGHADIAELLRARGATLPVQPAALQPTTRDEIIQHVSANVGPVNPVGWTEIVPGEVAVWIHVVPPAAGIRDYSTLFTSGMSDRPMTVPPGEEEYRYAELMIYLPGHWPLTREALSDHQYSWPIEWLRRLAHRPHEERTWIGPGYGIAPTGDPPQPITAGLSFDSFLLVSEHSPRGQTRLRDGRLIWFYTMLPLYPSERVLGQTRGIPDLIERLQEHEITRVVAHERPKVVP